MELQISTDELATRRLFIATPCYGGVMHGLTAKSFLDLQTLMNQFKVQSKFSFLFNESLITRARNYLVDEFLRSDCTHLLFIDADIHFNPQDVLTLLAMDKDISGGPYPKKSINWTNVKRAFDKNKDIAAGELEGVIGEFVFNPVAGTKTFSILEPLEVLEIGTGFMMVKREVFVKFAEKYPQYSYKPDHVGQPNFDGSRYIHAYFDTIIDSKESLTAGGSDRYLSEDYFFCQMARKMDYKIWLCPWMRTQHVGTYAFTGDLPKIAQHTGQI